MAGRTDGLIKTFRAGAAIAAFRIIKFGAADDQALQASAAADFSFGLSGELGAAQGEPVDVHMSDIGEVQYGGNVARGAPLTADANGKAITAAPAAGATVRIIGFAMRAGVADDIGAARISPGFMSNAA